MSPFAEALQAREARHAIEHVRRRLRERFGLLAGEQTVRDLARAVRERGRALPELDRHTDPGRGAAGRRRWYALEFRGRAMAACYDWATGLPRTVIPYEGAA